MPRDAQRARVYAAQREATVYLTHGGVVEHFGSVLDVPTDRRFGDVADVQPYLDAVLAYAPVAALAAGAPRLTVRERRGAREAHYEPTTATIAVPPYAAGGGWALREAVVLHELAHHLVESAAAREDREIEAHGPEFAAMLCLLFGEVIDPVAEHLLRVAMYEAGVRIGPRPAAPPVRSVPPGPARTTTAPGGSTR